LLVALLSCKRYNGNVAAWLFAAVPAEHISLGMQLLSSLIMLGGPSFLAAYGPQLLGACTAYVGEVVERGVLLLLPPVDLLLVAAPQQAAPLVLPFMQVRAVVYVCVSGVSMCSLSVWPFGVQHI
jgi:hypothetical protein